MALGVLILFSISCNSLTLFSLTSDALYCITNKLDSFNSFSFTYLWMALIWPFENIPSISNMLICVMFTAAKNNIGNSFNILYT